MSKRKNVKRKGKSESEEGEVKEAGGERRGEKEDQ